MFEVVLALHNLMRWVVLIFAVFALYRVFSGWLGRKEWTQADRRAGSFYTITLDIQLLLGLILYVIYNRLVVGLPILEHVVAMIVAVAIVHFGSVLSRRLIEPVKKFRAAAVAYSLSVLVILIAIPWYRPLLRV